MDQQRFYALMDDFLGIPEETKHKLWEFFGFFKEEMQNLNLTGLKRDEDIAVKLIIDSLAPLQFIDFEDQDKHHIADLGTGGGFPGVPLAIALPNNKFTLIDARKKKLAAVDRMTEKLGLQNVETLWGRAEELKEAHHFPVVVAKAFAPYPDLYTLAMPLVQDGGHFISFAGPNEQPASPENSKVLEQFGGEIVSMHTYDLPQKMGSHSLYVAARHI